MHLGHLFIKIIISIIEFGGEKYFTRNLKKNVFTDNLNRYLKEIARNG